MAGVLATPAMASGFSPYFFAFTACFAAVALFLFCLLALAFACFCAACLFVDFGDLSPIVWRTSPAAGKARA